MVEATDVAHSLSSSPFCWTGACSSVGFIIRGFLLHIQTAMYQEGSTSAFCAFEGLREKRGHTFDRQSRTFVLD